MKKMDSHTVGIYGVLLAVVLVGVVGLYFTSMASNDTSVVYVGGGYQAPSVTAWTPPFYSKLASITKPFMIKGRGITGLSQARQGTATISSGTTWDLRMPKNTIVCTAQLYQDNDTVALYTCGDNVSIGGSLVCDDNGTASSNNTPTTAATCNGTAAKAGSANYNFGAFVVCNMGQEGALNATLLNLTVGNATSSDTYLDNILYNAVDNDANKGCIGVCNNCNKTQADAGACDTYSGQGVLPECDYFDTSGQCLCECFSIHPNEDDIHRLKNGSAMEFVMRKSMSTTTINGSSQCT
jgi:hypothetical protein